MRKTIRLGVMFVLVLLIAFFVGCTDKTDNNYKEEASDEPIDEWFSIFNLNFNPEYNQYAENGRGFLLYDDADFNCVSFNDVDEFSVLFDVYYDSEKVYSLQRESNYQFENYRFQKVGKYSIKVSGQKNSGENLDGEFTLNVVLGNRPDQVEFIIKNSKGEEVNHIKGGDEYVITAKLYSNGKEYIPQDPQDVYWNFPLGRKNEYNLSLGNISKEETRKYEFFCLIKNNSNVKVNIVDESYTIYDNLIRTPQFPEGVYFDFGKEITSGSIQLNVNAEMDKWLTCVNNWAVCDSSVMNMKALGKPQNSDIVWKYVNDKIHSNEPFTKRAMVVILFSYFNNDLYIDRVINLYATLNDDSYYVKMAVAWGISVIAIKNFDVIVKVLKSKSFDKFTHNKAIQKCVESFRISTERKILLKKLKI